MSNPFKRDEGKGRLSDDDAARLSEHIAGISSSGLALAPGLRATAEEMPWGRLRSTLVSVASVIDSGSSVEEALEHQGVRLPGHLRGIIAIGARTGKFSQALARLMAYNNVGAALRRQLLISLAYPVLSITIAVAVFTFVCSALVPSFESIFNDFGVPLPALTQVILVFSHAFAMSWKLAVEFVIGMIVLWVLSLVVLSGPTRRTLVGGLPVIGEVWRNTSLAEFCHLLALLLECEVPLGEALRLTGEGVRDSGIERACRTMVKDVNGGMSFSQSLLRQPSFPKGMGRVLSWAEGNQSLPEALHMAGEMFEAGARVQGELAGTVLAVIAVVSVMAGIAVMTVGLFLPLITLISKLSG